MYIISKHRIVYLPCIQFLSVSHSSIKVKNTNTQEENVIYINIQNKFSLKKEGNPAVCDPWMDLEDIC